MAIWDSPDSGLESDESRSATAYASKPLGTDDNTNNVPSALPRSTSETVDAGDGGSESIDSGADDSGDDSHPVDDGGSDAAIETSAPDADAAPRPTRPRCPRDGDRDRDRRDHWDRDCDRY